jgi:hypothetical protein
VVVKGGTPSWGGEGAHVSVTHCLGPFGKCQAGTLPFHALAGLRQVCNLTASDAIHTNLHELMEPAVLNVLHQSCRTQRPALAKLFDGYAVIIPSLQNRLIGVVKDSIMCQKHGSDPTQAQPVGPNNALSAFYSIVVPPNEEDQHSHFSLVGHDGVCGAAEVSRFSSANHVVARFASAIPLSAPRVIYQTATLGTLMGECVSGEGADLLKRTFLELVGTSGGRDGTGVYHVPIATSQEIAQLLQLKTPNGRITLGRCKDGLFGYRVREDGLRTLIFVATCPEFLSDAPSPVRDSVVHVYKFTYSSDKPTAPRIFVCPVSAALSLCCRRCCCVFVLTWVLLLRLWGRGRTARVCSRSRRSWPVHCPTSASSLASPRPYRTRLLRRRSTPPISACRPSSA